MSKTLEEIALQVAKEVKGQQGDLNIQIVEFASRLVAALGAQEPVGFVYEKTLSAILKSKEACIRDTQIQNGSPLYAAPVVKEGWQMVPKEPTEAMLLAMKDGAYSIEREQDEPRLTVYDAIRLEYKAMLAAAPEYWK